MKCPNCKCDMEEGEAQVRGDIFSFLVAGFSIQNLVFDSSNDSRTILHSSDKRSACYCRHCGGLFLEGESTSESQGVDFVMDIV